MSAQMLTFFASPFGIKISHMLTIEMMMLEGNNDDMMHCDDFGRKVITPSMGRH